MSGERLDLSSDGPVDAAQNMKAAQRRFIGIHFVCCDVYTRIYIKGDESAYEGNCPKCAQRIRLRIGPGGTDSRFFAAG